MIYKGSKDDATIIFREYGERSDLTYHSIMNVVGKLLPTEFDVFEKYYTELKESEGDGFKITLVLPTNWKPSTKSFRKKDLNTPLFISVNKAIMI